jgi:hypothetical protein
MYYERIPIFLGDFPDLEEAISNSEKMKEDPLL